MWVVYAKIDSQKKENKHIYVIFTTRDNYPASSSIKEVCPFNIRCIFTTFEEAFINEGRLIESIVR